MFETNLIPVVYDSLWKLAGDVTSKSPALFWFSLWGGRTDNRSINQVHSHDLLTLLMRGKRLYLNLF